MANVKRLIRAASWAIGVTAICTALFVLFPVVFGFRVDRAVSERQKIILYQIDHPSLAILLRDFANQRRWTVSEPPKDGAFIAGNDPSLPPVLRLLKPSSVRIDDEQIDLEFGGALLHFGISAFRPGVPGSGTKQLGDGLWFYSDNGRYPSNLK